MGRVFSLDTVVTVTPVVDTAAYAAGDLLFDTIEVPSAARGEGGVTILHSVTILDKADQGVAMTLVVLNALTDMGTINAAPNPDDTEAETIIGWVPVATTDYIDVGASKIANVRNVGLICKAAAGTSSLYLAAINGSGTPTYGAASNLVLQLGFLQS